MPPTDTAPDPLPDLTPDQLEQTPAEFRTSAVRRLQGLINRNLSRLEQEGAQVKVRELPLQTAILLTKHGELTGIAPPPQVHNQTTIVNGINQETARSILAGRVRPGSRARAVPVPEPEPEAVANPLSIRSQWTVTEPEAGRPIPPLENAP